MPLLPTSPGHRKALAAAFLAVSLAALAFQAFRLLGHTDHDHDRPPVLLYDLERKALTQYPPDTVPGDHHTASLTLFAKAATHEKPAPGMTLEDAEKAGLQLGWLYRMADDHRTGLFADPRQPDVWVSSNSPECHAKLARWMDNAAAFSSTGKPILCRD